MSDKRPIRIGITLPDVGAGGVTQALWGSGHVQNAKFLAQVFEGVPGIKVFAVGPWPLAKSLKIEHTTRGPGYLDVIIEVGGKLSPSASESFRLGGGLLIHMVTGNTMALNMEAMSNPKGPADVPYGRYHRVWVLPHQMVLNYDYYSLVHKCPVQEAPMVWAPWFLPKDFGYVQQQRKVVASFEGSVSVVKTPHWSMLVGDVAEKADPGVIDEFKVFSSADKAREGTPFASFARSLSAYEKFRFEPRVPAPEAFKGLSAIVSHQWENELNYNHYEALYGRYPLVHNSGSLMAGYKFRPWDSLNGGLLLARVLREHENHLDQYSATADAVLKSISVEVVRPKYVELLMDLIAERDRVRTR